MTADPLTAWATVLALAFTALSVVCSLAHLIANKERQASTALSTIACASVACALSLVAVLSVLFSMARYWPMERIP